MFKVFNRKNIVEEHCMKENIKYELNFKPPEGDIYGDIDNTDELNKK